MFLQESYWEMKTLHSALTRFTIDKSVVFHLHIEHDIIIGLEISRLEHQFIQVENGQ